ncbi:rhamnogalacturonan lyase [Roseibacillus persicicus]|uniref:rhamnogalacturonan lyase n=1 Tax=Roseibacillus persicicus TaxID=454148 RepID=UPI00280E4D61|nr:rhamnogalacturonan lyase [Roseibacillus persicicus]MDQ8188917.1 rhamnogalacturonan lyase [Roseibacillus persicicus]
MMKRTSSFLLPLLLLGSQISPAQRLVERLDRGVIAVPSGKGVYVGWRMLGTEPNSIAYNVYRNGSRVNERPISDSTNFFDDDGTSRDSYSVSAVLDGKELPASSPVDVWNSYFSEVPLQRPGGGILPGERTYDYAPGDISVADLDGDGQLEIVLKWNPSESRDPSQAGYTGKVILDGYELDGTHLWRIDLGMNIRAGEHYTQFMVYDLDSDGRAEVVCKTADGTKDNAGTILGSATADYRNSDGRILSGPEYLSAFDGLTGDFIDTVDYIPGRGRVSSWGDRYGNRVDRFLAGVAYLDGRKPSVVMCRGYYTRTVLAAWDLVDRKLRQRWVFDTNDEAHSSYAGQGNHQLSVADVDSDGRDEIVYGSMTVDDDGTGLYTTGLGHGDALHVSDMDPNRPGLELWMPHETAAGGATYRDAATGEILLEHKNAGDVARGVAAHIDSRYPGYQLWSHARGGIYNTDGTRIKGRYSNKMMGFLVWWTGSLQREFLASASGSGESPVLERWTGEGSTRLLSLYNVPTAYDTRGIKGTKANPCFSGDILGDWREELILYSKDKTKLRIFTTPEKTKTRIRTLLHDSQYRLALAWQNVGYNQPPHPSFYLGEGMAAPAAPHIELVHPKLPEPSQESE